MENSKSKIIVLCLDGATWDIILPLVEKHQLPNFEKLMQNNNPVRLKSTIPPTTIPAWISMFSGLKPEQLGIMDFFIIDEKNRLKLVNSDNIKGKMIWDFLDNILVFNIPGTLPAYSINGILIADSPEYWSDNSIYPKDVREKLVSKFSSSLNQVQNIPVTRGGRIHHLKTITSLETDIFIYLYENFKDLELFVFRYEILDHIAHWAQDLQTINDAYCAMDYEIGRILSIIGKDDILVFVSDHGVQNKICSKRFFINSWLRKEGYLKTRKKFSISDYLQEKIGDLLILTVHIDRITLSRIYQKLFACLRFSNKSFSQIFLEKIDLNSSLCLAYNTSAGGYTCIRIGKKELIEELFKKLKSIKDPSGIAPIKNITLTRINNKPEIILEGQEDYIFNHEITSDVFKSGIESFKHSLYGIMLICTDRTTKSNKSEEMDIWDVFPILMNLSGKEPKISEKNVRKSKL